MVLIVTFQLPCFHLDFSEAQLEFLLKTVICRLATTLCISTHLIISPYIYNLPTTATATLSRLELMTPLARPSIWQQVFRHDAVLNYRKLLLTMEVMDIRGLADRNLRAIG